MDTGEATTMPSWLVQILALLAGSVAFTVGMCWWVGRGGGDDGSSD